MPTWIKVFIMLILLVGMCVTGYIVYKKLKKQGVCSFTAFTPSTPINMRVSPGGSGLVQAGYIECSEGGAFWKPGKIKVINNGPGIFYIGPINGQSLPQEIDPEKSLEFKIGNANPNVYYSINSDNSVPNFAITTE